MKSLFNKIRQALLDGQAFQNKPIRTVSLFNVNYLYHLEKQFTPLPAVLLEYRLDRTQKEIALDIHVLYEQVFDISTLSPNSDKSLEVLDFLETLRQELVGIESQNIGKLESVGERVVNWEIVSTYLLSFKASLTENKKTKYIQL